MITHQHLVLVLGINVIIPNASVTMIVLIVDTLLVDVRDSVITRVIMQHVNVLMTHVRLTVEVNV